MNAIRCDCGNLIMASFSENQPVRAFPIHRITHIREGSGIYHFQDLALPVVAGDLLLVAPGERAISVLGSMSVSSTPFSIARPNRLFAGACLRFSGDDVIGAHIVRTLEVVRRLLVDQARRDHAAVLLDGAVRFFTESVSVESGVPEAIRQSAERLTLHPAERISVAELASRAHLSESQFRRLFIRHYGESPACYAIRRRIEYACQLMEVEGLGVGDVARRLGYPDPFGFSRQFRLVQGYPPAAHAAHARAITAVKSAIF